MSGGQRPQAPSWHVERWFNAEQGLSLESLRGRVVLLHAFQMLCPGCVSHGIPQAQRVAAAFDTEQLAVVGLHSVFEHHQVMTPAALRAFIDEYQLRFPIAVDRAEPGYAAPRTMRDYAMRGTPTVVLIDRVGRIAWQRFGRPSDLELGTIIGQLLDEAVLENPDVSTLHQGSARCDANGCVLTD